MLTIVQVLKTNYNEDYVYHTERSPTNQRAKTFDLYLLNLPFNLGIHDPPTQMCEGNALVRF